MINKDEITVSRKKSFCQAKNEFLPKNPLKKNSCQFIFQTEVQKYQDQKKDIFYKRGVFYF